MSSFSNTYWDGANINPVYLNSNYTANHNEDVIISNKKSNQEYVTQALPIPAYKIAWIIGKKGSYIKQLGKKSGANITVSDSTSKEYGTVWKYLQLNGTSRSIDRAKKLIHIRMERFEARLDTATETIVDNQVEETVEETDVRDESLCNDSRSLII